MLSYEDLLNAYEWVSSDPTQESSAYVNRESGVVYLEADEFSEDDELPDDIDDETKYVAVPHKHELELGKALVFSFAEEHLPEDFEKISTHFRRPGAYSKFKTLLEGRRLLDAWHEYERVKTFQALLQWASDNRLPHNIKASTNAA